MSIYDDLPSDELDEILDEFGEDMIEPVRGDLFLKFDRTINYDEREEGPTPELRLQSETERKGIKSKYGPLKSKPMS